MAARLWGWHDDLGLLPTIDWFCREFDRLHPAIGVAQEISVQEKDVPARLKIVIYRIIESAFTNLARYENTDRIKLALRLEDGVITLAIDDTSQDSRYAATAERETESPQVLYGEAQPGRRQARRADRRESDLQVRFGEAQERTTLSGGSFTIARGKAGRVTLRASWTT